MQRHDKGDKRHDNGKECETRKPSSTKASPLAASSYPTDPLESFFKLLRCV
jgi:hypothetical protein